MSQVTSQIERSLRRCSRAERVPALLRALRLRPLPRPVALEALHGAERVAVVGEQGGLVVVLVEATSPDAAFVARAARRLRARDPARPHLYVFAGPGYRRLALAGFDLDGALRQLTLERLHPLRSDLETLAELADDGGAGGGGASGGGAGGVARARRIAAALDRSRLTRRFFREFKARRAAIAEAWTGVPPEARAERDRLALLLLCRLMFLYFLQRDGHLAGDARYMARLLAQHRRRMADGGDGSFFRAVLGPLFFGALNTRPVHRSAEARRLGALPYLNGGLFRRHALELRFPALDLPDAACAGAIDGLLEHYRFTTREKADASAGGLAELGVDPGMLGRVFEGLMTGGRRGATGTYFTPPAVVDRLVREAIAAWLGAEPQPAHAERLRRVRVLDPACGSGAFLLGALARLGRLRARVGGEAAGDARRDLVARGLYGVDLQHDASLLCALRLWLALTVADGSAGPGPPPLPNLDRRIRQGNALLEPLEFALGADMGGAPWRRAAGDAAVRRALHRLSPLATRYVSAGPERRATLLAPLRDAEVAVARAWLAGAERRACRERAELRALAGSTDLFGERTAEARRADTALRARRASDAERRRIARALDESGELPFFSFGVHFAEAAATGFDLVLSNPPWIRAHRWPGGHGVAMRQRYAVCSGGWRGGTDLARAPAGVAAQVDLALLFLERSLRLLAPGGALAMLLPAKALRALYGAGARRLLLREARLTAIEDHALDGHAIFRADAFAAAVVARKPAPGTKPGEAGGAGAGAAPAIRVTMTRRGRPPLHFKLAPDALPLIPGDPDAPWLLAPPDAGRALRRMQTAAAPLGQRLQVRRGVMTGANDVLVIRRAEAKLGDHAWIEADGAQRCGARSRRRYQALVEASALAPLVRGAGIRAWGWDAPDHVIWLRDDAGRPTPAPRRTAGYLERHARRLRKASRARDRALGTVQRVSAATLAPKVAWHDLADTLKAVALPARVRGSLGMERPLIPLNTVYFVAVDDVDHGLRLAALLNSLPARTFTRAVAERAKDARFRFFAWTVATLPLPATLVGSGRPGGHTGRHDDGGAAGDPGARQRARLTELSRRAHDAGGITAAAQTELDDMVGAAYGLSADDMAALRRFDHWLRGGAS